jgi:hypothetical protein
MACEDRLWFAGLQSSPDQAASKQIAASIQGQSSRFAGMRMSAKFRMITGNLSKRQRLECSISLLISARSECDFSLTVDQLFDHARGMLSKVQAMSSERLANHETRDYGN